MNSRDLCDEPPPQVLLKPRPKHKWSIVKEVIERENGCNKMPHQFPRKFYSSLHAVQRLELMYKLEAHSGCVNAINFNPSGTTLISGSDDTTVVVWDWRLGKRLSSFQSRHSSNVFQCKFLPLSGDKDIVTSARDGQVRLAKRNSIGQYESTDRLLLHFGACHKLAILLHTPHVFLSAGEDGCIYSSDIREDEANRLLTVEDNCKKVCLYSIHANPLSGNEFCVAGGDYKIRMYDRRCIKKSGSNVLIFYPPLYDRGSNEDDIYDPFAVSAPHVTCAVFNYNGSEIVGSYSYGDIYLFETKGSDGRKYAHRYEGHSNGRTIKGVNFFGPKSEFVVSGSDCGHIYFWDKNTEAIVQWMRGDELGVVNCLEAHPWIPVLATSGLDPDVKIWVPSCEEEPKMAGLERVVSSNKKENDSMSHQRVSLGNGLPGWWKNFAFSSRPEGGSPVSLFDWTLSRLQNSLNLSNFSVASSSDAREIIGSDLDE